MDKNTKIVLIICIVAVAALVLLFLLPMFMMVQMNEEASQNIQKAVEQQNTVMCKSTTCTTDAECVIDACDSGALCIGAQRIGNTTIPGHCEPLSAEAMLEESNRISENTESQVNAIMCALHDCTSDSDCNVEVCGDGVKCNVAIGKCEPK